LLAAAASVADPRKDFYGDPLPPGALARMGTLRLKTVGRVLAFSPDEKLFAVASPEQAGEDPCVVQLWSVSTELPVRRLEGPAMPIGDGVFSPDGKTFLAASHKQIVAWRVADGKRIRQTEAPNLFYFDYCRPVLSRDGKRWASRFPSDEMHVGETATGKALASLRSRPGRGWDAVTLSGDGKRAAGFTKLNESDEDDKGRNLPIKGRWVVWDVATRKTIGEFSIEGQNGDIYPGALSLDGRLLVIRQGSWFERRFRLWLWEPQTGRTLLEISDWDARVQTAQFTPDSRSLLIAAAREVRVWDIARQRFGRSLPAAGVHYLTCSPGGKYLATQGGGGPGLLSYFARLWDLNDGTEVFCSRPNHTADITEAAFSPDGRTLASGSPGPIQLSLLKSSVGEVLLWDARTGRPLGRCDVAPGQPHQLLFTPDGKLLAGVHDKHAPPRLLEIDPKTAKVLRTTPGRHLLAVSADGRRLLCQEGKGDDEIVVVRDRATGSEVCRHGCKGNLRHAGFRPGGERFVTVFAVSEKPGGEAVTVGEIHAAATGKRLDRWTRELISASVQPSPDGRLLAELTSGQEVQVLDVETGRRVFTARAEGSPHSGAFSPDGAFLALGHGSCIRLWELATEQQMHTFGSSATYPRSTRPLAFSPDGRRLASGGDSAELLIRDAFDPETSQEPLTEDPLQRCWQDLARSAGPRAYQAMRTLLGRPQQAVAFLGKRLTSVPAVEPAVLRRWLADLGSDSFQVRQEASQRLQEAGDVVEPDLRKALADSSEPETARRIRAVLATINPVRASGDRLRMLRAIQVLERAGTPPAQEVLLALAHGAPGARPTRAAQEALVRMRPTK
jgi:WD40 repeat protein